MKKQHNTKVIIKGKHITSARPDAKSHLMIIRRNTLAHHQNRVVVGTKISRYMVIASPPKAGVAI
jgi:hypothetical protein